MYIFRYSCGCQAGTVLTTQRRKTEIHLVLRIYWSSIIALKNHKISEFQRTPFSRQNVWHLCLGKVFTICQVECGIFPLNDHVDICDQAKHTKTRVFALPANLCLMCISGWIYYKGKCRLYVHTHIWIFCTMGWQIGL